MAGDILSGFSSLTGGGGFSGSSAATGGNSGSKSIGFGGINFGSGGIGGGMGWQQMALFALVIIVIFLMVRK